MDFWSSIIEQLNKGVSLCLLYVVHSEGSSPGRQGFRQFVNTDGDIEGSIGGGPMEQKLVDLAIHLLKNGETQNFLRRQVHQSNIEKNKSGMICSGEQTIAFCFLNENDISVVRSIISGSGAMCIDRNGLHHQPEKAVTTYSADEANWKYIETLPQKDSIYIVGGGHVSLALSQMMYTLGFKVIVLDDRHSLNTMMNNKWAELQTGIDYNSIAGHIPSDKSAYVAIMTTGFRSDKIVLKQLVSKKYAYLGMLGSREKIKRLFSELIDEGIDEKILGNIHAPIGISINSRTPEEIAVSIAAQIIGLKNAVYTSDSK